MQRDHALFYEYVTLMKHPYLLIMQAIFFTENDEWSVPGIDNIAIFNVSGSISNFDSEKIVPLLFHRDVHFNNL